MNPKSLSKSKSQAIGSASPGFDGLLGGLREIIAESRRQVLRTVDVVQVRTCWGVGRHIVEFEQGGAVRAEYGARLLPRLAEKLTEEFGAGFDASNLRYMRLFYLVFPNCDALRHELSWTHYRTLLRVEDAAAREWYVNETVAQNWSSRALERQVGRLYYERLLSSKDRKAVRAEAEEKLAELPSSPREFVRDPVLLEFLSLPGRLLESDLEQGLIDHLKAFLLELGKGFADPRAALSGGAVGRQGRGLMLVGIRHFSHRPAPGLRLWFIRERQRSRAVFPPPGRFPLRRRRGSVGRGRPGIRRSQL